MLAVITCIQMGRVFCLRKGKGFTEEVAFELSLQGKVGFER